MLVSYESLWKKPILCLSKTRTILSYNFIASFNVLTEGRVWHSIKLVVTLKGMITLELSEPYTRIANRLGQVECVEFLQYQNLCKELFTFGVTKTRPAQFLRPHRKFKREFRRKKKRNFTRVLRLKKRRITQAKCIHGRILMIYEIFINYMTEILSLRLEITMCTLRSSSWCLIDCLSLLKLRYRLPSRQIQVKKIVVGRLHAVFRSKLIGSPRGGSRQIQVKKIVVGRLHAVFRSKLTECIEFLQYQSLCRELFTLGLTKTKPAQFLRPQLSLCGELFILGLTKTRPAQFLRPQLYQSLCGELFTLGLTKTRPAQFLRPQSVRSIGGKIRHFNDQWPQVKDVNLANEFRRYEPPSSNFYNSPKS
uniref:Uncharacterized protein n=1 Tax=Cucumis melo TaxID=3656 RepID=A0A9I9EKR0_CUCME